MLSDHFVERRCGEFLVISYEPWLIEGIEHGFIGASGDFSGKNLEYELKKFKNAFGVELLLPNQTHSSIVLDASYCSGAVGDAVIASRGSQRGAIGVRTADCLPVLIKGEKHVAAVHAGWRGVASRIIEKVHERFSGEKGVEALMGPAAGEDSYEVGNEVIEAIGEECTYRRKGAPGKFLLDMIRTAEKQLLPTSCKPLFVCTITDPNYHSFRRSGEKSGRNLAYIMI